MIKLIFGKYIAQIVAKEVAKEVAKRDNEIKMHCGKLVRFIFEDAPDVELSNYGWGRGGFIKTTKGELKHAIAGIVIKDLKDTEQKRIDDKIAEEAFIDSVVDRIKRKQLD